MVTQTDCYCGISLLVLCCLLGAAHLIQAFVPPEATHPIRPKEWRGRAFASEAAAMESIHSADILQPLSSKPYPWASKDGSFNSLKPFYVYQSNYQIEQDGWQHLCPALTSNDKKLSFLLPVPFSIQRKQPELAQSAVDVTRFWTMQDDPRRVAADVMEECFHFRCDAGDCNSHLVEEEQESLMISCLAESLEAYRHFCRTYLWDAIPNPESSVRFKCRLTATTGPSGAKCPQYHMDQVLVRWIQTFVGPGVEFVVGNVGVRCDAFANADDDDDLSNTSEEDDRSVSWTPEERNQQLVDSNSAEIFCAQEGEAVLMLGNEWNVLRECKSKGAMDESSRVQPVVHKSPSVSSTQQRVLLTQDILFDW